jgi:hypothetical protein
MAGAFTATFIVCMVVGFYMLPTVTAFENDSPRLGKVFLVNLLTGWTGVGWFVAATMAVWHKVD